MPDQTEEFDPYAGNPAEVQNVIRRVGGYVITSRTKQMTAPHTVAELTAGVKMLEFDRFRHRPTDRGQYVTKVVHATIRTDRKPGVLRRAESFCIVHLVITDFAGEALLIIEPEGHSDMVTALVTARSEPKTYGSEAALRNDLHRILGETSDNPLANPNVLFLRFHMRGLAQ